MTQLEISFVRHSPTSRAAAEAIKPSAETLRGRVLWLLQHAWHTDEEMQFLLNMSPNTQRPRRVELVRMGLVVDSGRTAKTKSGRSAVVWRAA